MDKEDLEFRLNQVIYRKIFEREECDAIQEYYKFGLSDSNVLAYSDNYKKMDTQVSPIRKSKERFLSKMQGEWIKQKLLPHMQEINNKYFKLPVLVFGYFSLLEYGVDGEFKWHADQGTSGSTALRRISLVVFLSDRDEYEGGQLEFMPKLKEPLKMEKGYMIAFPSHKVHRVAPVTSGIRRTMVNWINEYRQS
ncbi:MAG: 2OG-Fe(II) oxygenase [Candidatus Sericytochromatia bacterium]